MAGRLKIYNASTSQWELVSYPDNSLSQPVNGWIEAPACSYNSATSILFAPGLITNKISTGMKIKLTNNSAVKYYTIANILTDGGSNNICELAGAVALTNSAITLPYYSQDDAPLGFTGIYVPFTPTFVASGGTVPTYANSAGYYTINGKTVSGYWNCSNTTGGTAGAGAVLLTMNLPVTVSSRAPAVLGQGFSYEASGTLAGVCILRNAGASNVFMQTYNFVNILAQDQSSADRSINGTFTYEMA